jgi:hypothetical protein
MRSFLDSIKITEESLKLGSAMRTVPIDGTTPVIKLGSNPAKAKLDAFMNDYHDATQDNPMDRRARLTTNASVEVSSFDNAIHISDVRALTPRQGGGKEAMMMLCRLADLHGVKMTLTAKTYGDYGRMTTEQLKSWYEDFGFAEDEDSFGSEDEGYDMIRYPN